MNIRTWFSMFVVLIGSNIGPNALAAPLHDAVKVGDLAQVSTLITSDMNINQKDSYGMTALQLAVRGDNVEIMEVLIAHGAEVNIANPEDARGTSPLHLAARKGKNKTVALLIAYGADVNARDWGEYTPLHNAAWNGNKIVAEMLIAEGANINATSYDGVTPIGCAIKKGHADVAALLKQLAAGQ